MFNGQPSGEIEDHVILDQSELTDRSQPALLQGRSWHLRLAQSME